MELGGGSVWVVTHGTIGQLRGVVLMAGGEGFQIMAVGASGLQFVVLEIPHIVFNGVASFASGCGWMKAESFLSWICGGGANEETDFLTAALVEQFQFVWTFGRG